MSNVTEISISEFNGLLEDGLAQVVDSWPRRETNDWHVLRVQYYGELYVTDPIVYQRDEGYDVYGTVTLYPAVEYTETVTKYKKVEDD